ncbi:tetratricopeptide repeat protein 12 isoform X2 [Astyanax mexicanus]|uniref:tetratricopeptide repeat protein 12 isoform X2 n=2 Tax=Astyanax mexicanus TaxID=7994 RepID=UPI0020CAEAA8|nr:tetratricopeptide repeat protein 12 isoform X2 [Astyanax mexicanus]
MSLCEYKDLERFLENVDHISDLMKELNSSDESTQEKALEKADQFISSLEENETCRTRLSRTVINKSPSRESRPTNASDEPRQSPENFMKALEEDADERRKRRQVKEELAKALKEKGNKAFAQGEYEVAVKFYTEGLEQLRDMQALYTNRAQALIKLEKYKEAISDCEWALKCSDKCIKAHVHMGRAHLALKNFTESRICFEKILDIEPERGVMVKDYLSRVDQEQKKVLEEKTVRDKLIEGKEGITTVPDLLIKLDRPNQSVFYYCGGVQLLSEAIKDSTGQTLFRLNNGFSVISGNNAVRSSLTQTSKEQNSEELCVSVLRLWRAVCCGNEENQQLLLQCSSRREQIVQLLDSAASAALRQACLHLLCLFCETQYGRGIVTENLDLHRMVKNMMDCFCRNIMSGTTALAVLEKLAGENKFRVQFREKFADVFAAPFEHLLGNISVSSLDLLPSLISVIGAMCRDEVISRKLGSREEFWRKSFSAVGRCADCEYRRVLYPLLGLMINVSHNPAPVIREHAVEICSRCVVLLSDADGGIITRAAGLLSKILPKSAAAVQEVVQQGVVKRLLKILKGAGQISSRYSITALAACTASSLQASEELVKFDKRLVTVRMLLGSSDEVVVGNAALCLGHCSAVPGAAAGLLGSDCVLLLLRRAAGDAERAAVQQNAAITLGKICRAEPRHMLKLRELHCLEILHSCMKVIT